MKACIILLVCIALLLPCAVLGEGMIIENGMAQPMARYTDAQSLRYTNAGSDLLRYVVYVETDYDTDLDGKPDLIKTMVQVPRLAAEGAYQAPVIYEARPYIAGMYTYQPDLPAVGASSFDERILYSQPEKRIPKGTITTLEAAFAAINQDKVGYGDETSAYRVEMLVPEDVTPKGAIVVCAGGDHGDAVLHRNALQLIPKAVVHALRWGKIDGQKFNAERIQIRFADKLAGLGKNLPPQFHDIPVIFRQWDKFLRRYIAQFLII